MDLSSIFEMVVLSSAMGSMVAVLILGVKWLLKSKLSAFWQYYIWFLLVIRLVVPVGFETPLSKLNVIVPAAQKVHIAQNSPEINSSQPESSMKVKNNSSEVQSQEKGSVQEVNSHGFNYYFNVAGIIWAAVAVLSAAIILFVNFLFTLKINRESWCKDMDTVKLLERCKSRMNISRFIPIVYDTHVGVPSLLGVVKPQILISPDLLNNISYEEKKYIFLHELAHFKRKDIFVSWIMLFLGIINWFNPVILFALHRMREDSEISCDAYVLSYLGKNEYRRYGETIIDFVKFISNSRKIPGSIGIARGKSNMKRRMTMIKNFKNKPQKWWVILAFALISVFIMGMTNLPGKTVISANEKNDFSIRKSNIDYVNIVKKFLPQNSKIITSNKTKEEDNVLLKDLDNDGRDEIITAYRLAEETSGEDEKMSILVLKEKGQNWVKVLDEPGAGIKLDAALTADLDGDGKQEVLLGRRIGETAAQLSVYEWSNNGLDKISREDIYYSKLDVVNVQGNSRQDIAVWQHDTGEAYIVDVLKWNKGTFIQDEENYRGYFKEVVVPYYEEKVKAVPDTGFYWYYLADAQIKAGDKKDALKSIDKGLQLNTGYPSPENFNKLKEKALK